MLLKNLLTRRNHGLVYISIFLQGFLVVELRLSNNAVCKIVETQFGVFICIRIVFLGDIKEIFRVKQRRVLQDSPGKVEEIYTECGECYE